MRWRTALLCTGLGLLGWGDPVLAHGANINYQVRSAIAVTATYDSGEPMAEAQVTVYAPEDPSEPWKTGVTDDQGRYVFVPDAEQSGEWSVSVRQAGHGDIVTLDLGESATPNAGDTATTDASPPSSLVATSARETSIPQRVLTVSAVVWGCVGTALYFSRNRKS